MKLGVFVGSSPLEVDGTALEVSLHTPWGKAASAPVSYRLGKSELILVARHGPGHHLAPHQINYRANVWLMHTLGVDAAIGTYTVGGIDERLAVGDLVVPHQIIDYTWGRESTFDDTLRHIDFSYPFDVELRKQMLQAGAELVGAGVYGCTQGPRLETAAEIRRMANDGCSVVGMTAMPEAALCRELELRYAGLCLVVNPAAGVGDNADNPFLSEAPIDMAALTRASKAGAAKMLTVLEKMVGA